MKKLRRKKPAASEASAPGGGSKKKVVLIAGLIVAAGVYYSMQDEELAPVAPPSMPAKDVAPEPVPAMNIPRPPEIIPESAPYIPPMDLDKFRARAYANNELGIKGIKLGIENGVMKIPLTFIAQKRWCVGGDLDTIKYLNPKPDEPEFLVSIESLTGKQRGDQIRVTSKTLFAGFEKVFSIPIRNKTESLGLFLCRDQDKKNSCRAKTIISHGELSAQLAKQSTADEAARKDYLLYFQNFIVKDGELISYSNDDVRPETVTRLRKHLVAEYGVEVPDFNSALEINKVLRSLSAKIDKTKINLTLPYNDPRCMPGSGTPNKPVD